MMSLAHQYLVAMGACNLKCQYCWYETGDLQYTRTHVKPEHLDHWLTACGRGGLIETFTLTGGEPMLRRDFGLLLDVVKTHRLNAGLLTNATLITADWARRFREDDIEVHVSLDSVSPEYHNSIRGHHEAVMRGVHLLADADVPRRYLTMVVSRGNLGEIEAVRRFALQFGFGETLYPAARPADHPLALRRCDQAEFTVLMASFRSWSEEHDKRYYAGLVAAVAREGAPPPLSGCAFARHALVIDSDGSFYPCFHHKGERLGSIFDATPDEVLARKSAFYDRVQPASCIKADCLGVF